MSLRDEFEIVGRCQSPRTHAGDGASQEQGLRFSFTSFISQLTTNAIIITVFSSHWCISHTAIHPAHSQLCTIILINVRIRLTDRT